MIAIRLEEPLVKSLDLLAKSQHTRRSSLIREAIVRLLEDSEDLALAKSAKQKTKSSKSLSQLRKELGLDS